MKSSIIGLCFAALLMGASFPVQAQNDSETSYSYYLISCGSYAQHRRSGIANDANNTADMFYIAGWLSAYNQLRPDDGIPDDTTLDDIALWLEQYCHENPLSNIEAGLFKLGDEVKPRHDADHKPAPSPATGAPHMSVQGLKPLNY